MTNLAAVRFLADCLALDDSREAELERDLRHGHVDWRQIIWLASGHLVTPSLSTSIQRRGWLPLLPPAVADYLDAFRQLNRERNAIFRQALEAIAAALNPLGLEPLLLKGANALLPDTYPGAEDRMLGDLDLYLPEDAHPVATAALIELGYRIAHESWQWVLPEDRRRSHHGIPLMHEARPVKVELHRRIVKCPKDDILLVCNMGTKRATLTPGVTVQVPDLATRLRHNFLHAQITDRQARLRLLNFRQLLEFARLAQGLEPTNAQALLAGVRPIRQQRFLEYWALAEHWLGLAYPQALPRSSRQKRELWLTERVAESRAWSRGFWFHDALLRLPPRLLRLGPRIVRQPGYLPVKLKSLLDQAGSNRNQDEIL
jgi:hypothetical protein